LQPTVRIVNVQGKNRLNRKAVSGYNRHLAKGLAANQILTYWRGRGGRRDAGPRRCTHNSAIQSWFESFTRGSRPMRWEDLPQSENVEDRRSEDGSTGGGGLGGLPVGRGGLGIGTTVVLCLGGWALG